MLAVDIGTRFIRAALGDLAGNVLARRDVPFTGSDLDSTIAAGLEAEAHDARLPLVGRFDVKSKARADLSIELVADTTRIHFFDLDTGAGIYGD